MTKVKTILKEFCSAKDILAINRLGLLSKGEERESQPIPWRHRLKQGERKELVRSEMRMSLHRPSSRQSAKDKIKAVTTAQNPQLSKMGELLLHESSKGGVTLDGKIERINNEKRRSQSQMYQTRRSFLQQSQCLNREPMIVVERPPHPDVRTRAAFMERHGVDPALISIPSYQRPLLTRARTPSTLTTIEAFTVESKRKKNVWEEATEEIDEPKFKATAKPSARLTEQEKKQLKIGHTIHKPTQESIAQPRKPVQHKKAKPKMDEDTLRRSSSDSGIVPPTFLTEVRNSHSSKTPDGKLARSLLLNKKGSSLRSVSPKPIQSHYPFAPAVPHGISPRKTATTKPLRSLSAGPNPGARLVKSEDTNQRNSADVETSRIRGKKMKDFLSVLLEDENI